MKLYFFVTTFGSLYNKVLPLIYEKRGEGEIVVITANKNIYLFFKTYISCDVLYLAMNPNIFSRKKRLSCIFETYRMRMYYNANFKHIIESQIYFFGSGWTIGIFHMIQRLSKHNIVYQYPSDQSPTQWDYVTTWKAKVMKLITKLLTDVDVDVVTDSGMISLNLNEKFYKKNDIVIVKEETDRESLNTLMHKFVYDEEILIVTEDVVKYDRVERSEYLLKMSTLIRMLNNSKRQFRYKVKPHPNEPQTYGLFPSRTIIPHFIPSEFVMANHWKYVIGLESLTLIKAAQLTKAKVISLIDFIEYKDPSVSKSFKDWQQRESNKILFPKNEKELEEMLS